MLSPEKQAYDRIQQYEEKHDYENAINLCLGSSKSFPESTIFKAELDRLRKAATPKRKYNSLTQMNTIGSKTVVRNLFSTASTDLSNTNTSTKEKSSLSVSNNQHFFGHPRIKKNKSAEKKEKKRLARMKTGRLGEAFAYEFMKKEYMKKDNLGQHYEIIQEKEKDIGCILQHTASKLCMTITWCNKHEESGYPYDIAIETVLLNGEKKIEYFEVKATEKAVPWFAVFRKHELAVMRELKDSSNYFILRIYNVFEGAQEHYVLKKYDNPYSKLFVSKEPENFNENNNIRNLGDQVEKIKMKL